MERMTKKIVIALAVIVVALQAVPSLSYAASQKELWKQHERGVNEILQCYCNGKDALCYENGLRDVLSTELALTNTGISPKHPDLVMHFMNDLKTADDLTVFAWRVVKHRISRRTGSTLSVWGCFSDEEYKVGLNAGEIIGGPVSVRINKY